MRPPSHRCVYVPYIPVVNLQMLDQPKPKVFICQESASESLHEYCTLVSVSLAKINSRFLALGHNQ